MKLFALVVNDRHEDTSVRLFVDEQNAVTHLNRLSRYNGWSLDVPTPAPWIVSCADRQTPNADNAHVVEIEVEP